MKILKNEKDQIIATSAKFELMPVSETYDRYGQLISEEESGGYDVLAYNYWDGNNWKTIRLEDDYDSVEWEELSEEESKPYLAAIENKEFLHEKEGVKWYKGDDYYLAYSLFASSWEDFSFHLEEELEYTSF